MLLGGIWIMIENGAVRVMDNQRWTSKRKASAVLEIIQGKVMLIDFCRANDLKQSDVQGWIGGFISAGTETLKANPKQIHAEHRKEVEELQQVIGEQALKIRVLKKSIEIQTREENSY